MESLNVKEVGMNGLLVNLKEFKSDMQETVKGWISKENYSQFKRGLEQYEDEDNIDIWLYGYYYYGMDKQDVETIVSCLMDVEGFCEQGEDLRYNFYLDSRLIYTVDLDLI